MHLRANFIVILLAAALLAPQTFAQSRSSKSGTTFVSNLDEGLTLKKVVILPFKDNVSSIYAKPLTDRVVEDQKNLNLWEVEKDETGFDPSNAAAVQKYLKSKNAQGLITGQILKGPASAQITVSMYSAMDGKLLYQARHTDIHNFNLDDMQNSMDEVHEEMIAQIPYRGMILSRRGQEVTINLGTKNGLRSTQTVTVLQVVKLNRHPKLGFIVGTDKVILGKVKIYKADEFLSFGEIEFEKEIGAVQVNQKVIPDSFIAYPTGKNPDQSKALGEMSGRPDEKAVLGENPKEWFAQSKPRVGALRFQAGILQYQESVAFPAVGTKTVDTTMAPTLQVGGELWLSDLWLLDADIRYSIFSSNNPYGGATPGSIDMSVGYYSLAVGYNFLLGENFFGSKFQGLIGMSQFTSSGTQTTPIVVTDMSYGGIFLGLRGFMDIGPENPWLFGAQFKYHLTRDFAESPSSGTGTTPTITEFDFLLKRIASERMNYVGDLGFSFYDSNFTGSGARTVSVSSVSHKNTYLTVGIEYLF